MVDRNLKAGRMRVTPMRSRRPISRPTPNAAAVYIVRTRVSPKRDSPNSNSVSLRIHPAADPIDDLQAEIAPAAIVLTWTPPQKTIVAALSLRSGRTASIARKLSRSRRPPRAPRRARRMRRPPVPKIPSRSPRPSKSAKPMRRRFHDNQVVFGKTYEYSVRSIVQYPDVAMESADSNLVVITREIFFRPPRRWGSWSSWFPRRGDARPSRALLGDQP